jgi:hypothetical protein
VLKSVEKAAELRLVREVEGVEKDQRSEEKFRAATVDPAIASRQNMC